MALRPFSRRAKRAGEPGEREIMLVALRCTSRIWSLTGRWRLS